MRDPIGAILVFVGVACILIAACSAAGFFITFRP
ncbi:hypothetical protein PCO31010_02609 [Pandoraea commovens]|uniref:Lipoprotein n=1 Tax=Pandoraea commovens TaxID=2508289 RepID=A0A5E4VD59_9BURK|nr:hypothetical protein PCO31010_02609 [Pandoraea commovens]